ncbi:type II toxin-antitoxin system HicB family antitoxin [Candidatus Falkowbacteria bacterium]|nr:type II toxin-antitoxin system HicB family antitoxin [Candidatus Falkowbacteria bacterium]
MPAKKQKPILEYPAFFEPIEEGGYNVSFPAFPGCVTFGCTFEQAQEKAKEVLELWLEELAQTKKEIPIVKSRPVIADIKVVAPPKTKLTYASHNR